MSPWRRGHFHTEGFARKDVFGGRGLVEQSAAEWQHSGSFAVCEEAEVADTGRASRQHMQYAAVCLVHGFVSRALVAFRSGSVRQDYFGPPSAASRRRISSYTSA
jgi:hypothetical protein